MPTPAIAVGVATRVGVVVGDGVWVGTGGVVGDGVWVGVGVVVGDGMWVGVGARVGVGLAVAVGAGVGVPGSDGSRFSVGRGLASMVEMGAGATVKMCTGPDEIGVDGAVGTIVGASVNAGEGVGVDLA